MNDADKIIMIPIYELKPFNKNPRNNQKAIAEVAKSIEFYGFRNPIQIDQNNRVAAGHTRLEAAKILAMITVPCIRTEMTEAEFIAYNIADNKTGELASWDKNILQENLSLLDGLDELEIPGFTDAELDKILEVSHSTTLVSQDAQDAAEGGKLPPKQKETIERAGNAHKDDAARLREIKLIVTPKDYRFIMDQLEVIRKNNDLDTMVDALKHALKGFKGKR